MTVYIASSEIGGISEPHGAYQSAEDALIGLSEATGVALPNMDAMDAHNKAMDASHSKGPFLSIWMLDIEQPKGNLPPMDTLMGKRAFVQMYMLQLMDSICSKLGQAPESWDGYELRQLVRDTVSIEAWPMTKGRRLRYNNVLNTTNIL